MFWQCRRPNICHSNIASKARFLFSKSHVRVRKCGSYPSIWPMLQVRRLCNKEPIKRGRQDTCAHTSIVFLWQLKKRGSHDSPICAPRKAFWCNVAPRTDHTAAITTATQQRQQDCPRMAIYVGLRPPLGNLSHPCIWNWVVCCGKAGGFMAVVPFLDTSLYRRGYVCVTKLKKRPKTKSAIRGGSFFRTCLDKKLCSPRFAYTY